MQIIASTDGRGLYVEKNADNLSGSINDSQTTIVVTQDTFDDGDTVTIDQEDIIIGSGPGPTYTGCTRGANGTTATSHNSSANVLLADGTTLLSHTFNGSTYLSAIRVGCREAVGVFGIKIDGTLKYQWTATLENLEKIFPMVKWLPPNGTVIEIVVWTWSGGNYFAEMQS